MNIEQQFINALTKKHRRSPNQINRIHESDAELIKMTPNGPIMAITTDTLVEEIAHSLYADPFLIGWMSVMCCASDLAAVGAKPLGILISATFTDNHKDIEQIQLGIKEACEQCSLPLIGGDTNFSTQLSLTGTAIGIIQEGKPLMRSGGKPGDILACSGSLGKGSLFAYQTLLNTNSSKITSYRPIARLKEGELLKFFASSCIDTSDGLFSCLEDMMGINKVGFRIDPDYEHILSGEILSANIPIPYWAFLAGHHGEYELVFTIDPEQWEFLVEEGKRVGWTPLKLGEVVENLGIHLNDFSLSPGIIRKTWNDSNGDINQYFNQLLALGGS